MRPEAFKNIKFSLVAHEEAARDISRVELSFVLLNAALFSLIFFTMNVLAIHKSLMDFFKGAHKELPRVTRILLETSSYEYMGACAMVGLMLIVKERMKNKAAAFAINLAALVGTWAMIFFYIWGASLPLSR